MTMMLSPRRNGSGKKAPGRRKTSEFEPSAWPVDDPSKFHSFSSSSDLTGPSRVCSMCVVRGQPAIQPGHEVHSGQFGGGDGQSVGRFRARSSRPFALAGKATASLVCSRAIGAEAARHKIDRKAGLQKPRAGRVAVLLTHGGF